MEMGCPLRGLLALCLLSFCLTPALSFYCLVDVKHTLNERQPLILQANNNAFAYPAKSLSPKIGVEFFQNLRLACTGSNLVVQNNNLNVSEASVRCYGMNFFQVLNSRHVAPFNTISCAQQPVAVAVNGSRACPNGEIAQIGYQLSSSVFLPTISEVCFNSSLGQTLWTHHKLINAVSKRQHAFGLPPFQTGSFYPNITISSATFTAAMQRQRFRTLFNDTATVNKYIPENGDNFLVEGMLTPRSDLFYRLEQYSAFFYINTVPIWKSVHDNNWRQVKTLVRKFVKSFRKSFSLDVWTGGLDVLQLDDASGTPVNVTLTTDTSGADAIPVPRYLFKYVVDQIRNRGVVFITLNNPYATAVARADHLCEPLVRCRVLYPFFSQISQGYTYCCAINSSSGFFAIAEDLGLPTFPDAEQLFKPWTSRMLGTPESQVDMLAAQFWQLF